jgi:CheY-like chemotaxis protein
MLKRPNVLLIEGNEAEEKLAQQAIANSQIGCDVRVARDGVEACRILFESDDPAPTLVLLELDSPNIDGFDLIAKIREQEKTKRLPVIVYSASGNEADVKRCLDLHANSFVQKDDDPECYETRLKLLLYYWIAVNRNVNT